MERTVIVLDSFEYKLKEKELQKSIENICNPIFVYTKYENALTEIFQRTKLVGGFLTHISYWLLSLIYALRLLKCRNKTTASTRLQEQVPIFQLTAVS